MPKSTSCFALTAKRARALILVFIILGAPCAQATENALDQTAQKAGLTVGSAAHAVGQEGKKIGLTVGQEGKKVGLAIGHAAKAGGLAFWHAVKGESR
jgi:hypothetical protein